MLPECNGGIGIQLLLFFSCTVMSDSCNPMDCSTLGFPVFHCLPEFAQMHVQKELVRPSNHLILCCPLLLPLSIFPSMWLYSNELVLHIRWPKYWSFSFSISPSNEYSGWISFRIYWFDLLTVQGTLKSLLQHHSSKASVLKCSTFFMVQLSHPYKTTGKTIALTIWTFIGKVMSLLFNMLSRFVIALLPRSKGLLISWPQLPSTVILEPKKIVRHCFHFSPFFCYEVMGLNAMIFVFWMLSFKLAFSHTIDIVFPNDIHRKEEWRDRSWGNLKIRKANSIRPWRWFTH